MEPASQRKTSGHKPKPISATYAAFMYNLGLLVCWMSGSNKTGAFEILTKPRVKKCPIIYLNPLKECSTRGRGDIFSKSNKRCARKTLGPQSEP